MSEYSGKCDVYDWFQDDEEKIKNTKIYINNELKKINTIKDLIPYYPYTVRIGTNNTVWFSSASYVDRNEAAHFKYKLLDAKKAYRKVKRKKNLELTINNVYNNWYHSIMNNKKDNEIDREITRRVVEDYECADTRGLHSEYYNYYRKLLFNKMIEVGYTVEQAIDWVYGK